MRLTLPLLPLTVLIRFRSYFQEILICKNLRNILQFQLIVLLKKTIGEIALERNVSHD